MFEKQEHTHLKEWGDKMDMQFRNICYFAFL